MDAVKYKQGYGDGESVARGYVELGLPKSVLNFSNWPVPGRWDTSYADGWRTGFGTVRDEITASGSTQNGDQSPAAVDARMTAIRASYVK